MTEPDPRDVLGEDLAVYLTRLGKVDSLLAVDRLDAIADQVHPGTTPPVPARREPHGQAGVAGTVPSADLPTPPVPVQSAPPRSTDDVPVEAAPAASLPLDWTVSDLDDLMRRIERLPAPQRRVVVDASRRLLQRRVAVGENDLILWPVLAVLLVVVPGVLAVAGFLSDGELLGVSIGWWAVLVTVLMAAAVTSRHLLRR